MLWGIVEESGEKYILLYMFYPFYLGPPLKKVVKVCFVNNFLVVSLIKH